MLSSACWSVHPSTWKSRQFFRLIRLQKSFRTTQSEKILYPPPRLGVCFKPNDAGSARNQRRCWIRQAPQNCSCRKKAFFYSCTVDYIHVLTVGEGNTEIDNQTNGKERERKWKASNKEKIYIKRWQTYHQRWISLMRKKKLLKSGKMKIRFVYKINFH